MIMGKVFAKVMLIKLMVVLLMFEFMLVALYANLTYLIIYFCSFDFFVYFHRKCFYECQLVQNLVSKTYVAFKEKVIKPILIPAYSY